MHNRSVATKPGAAPLSNFFIAQPPYALPDTRPLSRLINKGFKLLKVGYRLAPPLNPVVDMNTLEQRINFFHLLDGVVANHIAGDVIELGCFTGQCAMLFQQVLAQHHSDKTLHLYDSFDIKFTEQAPIEDVLRANFAATGLRLPTLHKGYFQDTIPAQLPERIAFAHIDCGFGGDLLAHKEVMRYCLDALYPRLSPGALCVLMDYHDRSIGDTGCDVNPGVKLACDEFLATKPEQIVCLYGNQASHAFFRKVA